jgi:hypothetical protein
MDLERHNTFVGFANQIRFSDPGPIRSEHYSLRANSKYQKIIEIKYLGRTSRIRYSVR